MAIVKTRLVIKHDTEENWAKATSFIPLLGELIVYDPDASFSYCRVKMGDGVNVVSALPFMGALWNKWSAADLV